ncbi:MAG: HAMP domain-containing histidine kinase [Gammaproteobacteria bacterium]|nr:HAMP domain-containing histidine kinase [Gammaproteobacteria bacterium]
MALTLLLLGIGLLYIFLSASLAKHYQHVFLQHLNRNLAQDLIADRQLIDNGTLNEVALKKTFMHYMTVNPSIEIYLLDSSGNILSFSAEPGHVKRSRVDMEPVRAFLSGQNFPLLGNDPRSFDRNKIFSVAPIPTTERPNAYLYIVLRGELYDRTEQLFQGNFIAQLSGVAVMVSLVMGLFLGLLLFRILTKRLKNLTYLIEHFSANNFTEVTTYAENNERPDEIEKLGSHYNRMALRIRDQMTDLIRQDTMRRELVANVSHDLRTPLAALQGYIETLRLKDDELNYATRTQYLDVALMQSRRLTRLVNDLFELAKLDAHEMHINPEPFSLGELAQDVIQKFQLLANKQRIQLHLIYTQALPFVEADIALIERVLENFMSNALSNTSPDGKIEVALLDHAKGIRIEVRDNGKGISDNDLPHIFERSYQSGNSERGGEHAGLGLAIAQRIIKLHGDTIEVRSTPGLGTVFAFCLPTFDLNAAITHK